MLSIAPAQATVPTQPSHDLDDDGLLRLLTVGILVGAPMVFVISIAIALLAGLAIGPALAIGIIPALSAGVTFGGFIPLMLHLGRRDKAVAKTRSAALLARSQARPMVEPVLAPAAA